VISLAARTFFDRWSLFVGSIIAVALGVGIVHAGMTIILGVENSQPPLDATPAEAEAFRQAASGANTLTGMTVMLGAFLTVFVVASTIGFAADQRRHDLATLRIAGVTAGQIRRLLLGEALLVSIVGALIGAVLGFVLTSVQGAILSGLGVLPSEIDTPVAPAVLILDFVVAVVVSVWGAWGSARRATRVRPLDALRRTPLERRVMGLRRWVVAVIALVLTGVQVFFSATSGGMLIPLLLGLGIIITASVAMSRLAPLLVPAIARMVAMIAPRRPVPSVAVANLRDSVGRTASCAAPMIVLVSIVMGLQGILDTQTAAGETEQTLIRADLVVSGQDFDVDRAEQIGGVRIAAPETVVPLSVRLTRDNITLDGPGTVVAVDPDRFRQIRQQKPASGDLDDFNSQTIVFGSGLDSLTVNGQYDNISLQLDGTAVPLRQAARLPETLAGSDGFYIDRSILPASMLAERITSVLVQLEPGADVDKVRSQLAGLGATRIDTPSTLVREDASTKDGENRAVMGAIVGLGSLYALISVLSTVAISIGQRRSELATLRLSGMTKRQVQGAVIAETLSATLIGLILGAVAAITSMVGLWIATLRAYGTPVIAIPWALLAAITLATLALTAATAAVATRSTLRGNAVSAVGAAE
jgi:putative ABC transport system permease protein